MQDQKIGYSAMLVSVFTFTAIGLLDYYPLVQYFDKNEALLDVLYRFLSKFAPLRRPYYNKLFLFLTIVGSVMSYYPKKVIGKTVIKGLALVCLGILQLLFSELFKTSNPFNYGFSLGLYFLGFCTTVWGTVHLFQVMDYKSPASKDPFNKTNETFLQMEERVDTPYSVNIPYDYIHKETLRKGWINFVNLFRGLLIIGTPGSGKSFAIIEEIIEQFIQKRFTLLIYDFKFDTLSKIAYSYWFREQVKAQKEHREEKDSLPEFYVLNFDNVARSHRCNPLDPYLLKSQMDASDAATVIMKNLNKEWIKRNDFFSRSAISFVSGLIWYLKKKSEEHGKNLCTLPHVIILSTVNIEGLLSIMLPDMEVRNLMIPFKDALEREAGQQLAGQTASAQISLSMLANKEIFYVMTGNDFQLDINNPKNPKIVCIQNNPNRSEIYAAPIGLYINKVLQLVNQPKCRPCGLILDELPTVFLMGLRKIIDTGRSHLVATVLGIQSISQLIADYGKELADVLFDNCANVFSGAAKGETARRVSELFGRIHQEKKAQTLSKNDTTTNITTDMMELLPKSKISGMSTGYFGGIVADTFKTPISQKLCFGLLRPNLASKKIQGKHTIPDIRNFKPENYSEQIQLQLDTMNRLEFCEAITKMDLQIQDYITFYHTYIPVFADNRYPLEADSSSFIQLIEALHLFDHLHELQIIIKKKDDILTNVRAFMLDLLDINLVQKEKERVLHENFHSIIEDIDTLVKREHLAIHGRSPEFGIFDTDKISREIEQVMKQDNEAEVEDKKTYYKMATEQLLDRYTGSQEKATFETVSLQPPTDIFLFGTRMEDADSYSSYPVELIEE